MDGILPREDIDGRGNSYATDLTGFLLEEARVMSLAGVSVFTNTRAMVCLSSTL